MLTAAVSSTAQLLLLLQLSTGCWLLLSASSMAGVWGGWWRPTRGIWLQAHQPRGKRSRLPRLAADKSGHGCSEAKIIVPYKKALSYGSDPTPTLKPVKSRTRHLEVSLVRIGTRYTLQDNYVNMDPCL
jgi:hypothetical protein